MSRNIPAHLRHKQRPEVRKAIYRDMCATTLRIGALIVLTICLYLFVASVIGLFRTPRSGIGPWLLEPVCYAIASAAAGIVVWRLWQLKRWACAIMLVAAWLFCILEPWRPAYPGGQVDPVGAVVASIMAAAVLAGPLTLAWWMGRSQLRPGF